MVITGLLVYVNVSCLLCLLLILITHASRLAECDFIKALLNNIASTLGHPKYVRVVTLPRSRIPARHSFLMIVTLVCDALKNWNFRFFYLLNASFL